MVQHIIKTYEERLFVLRWSIKSFNSKTVTTPFQGQVTLVSNRITTNYTPFSFLCVCVCYMLVQLYIGNGGNYTCPLSAAYASLNADSSILSCVIKFIIRVSLYSWFHWRFWLRVVAIVCINFELMTFRPSMIHLNWAIENTCMTSTKINSMC